MPIDALTILSLVATSFVATNMDNLALLVGWLISGQGDIRQRRQIFLGHLLGMSTLLLLACAFGFGANFIPVETIGYLGILPIVLGLRGLYEIFRAGGRVPQQSIDASGQTHLMISVAATQIGNGVDTLLVLGPLLADSESGIDYLLIGGFIAMVLIWFRLARFLETHASRLRLLDRYGHWIAPVVLIVVGFYILSDTATDVVP